MVFNREWVGSFSAVSRWLLWGNRHRSFSTDIRTNLMLFDNLQSALKLYPVVSYSHRDTIALKAMLQRNWPSCNPYTTQSTAETSVLTTTSRPPETVMTGCVLILWPHQDLHRWNAKLNIKVRCVFVSLCVLQATVSVISRVAGEVPSWYAKGDSRALSRDTFARKLCG